MELGLLDHVERRGELKGKRELIREQLEERFGALPSEVTAALDMLPQERLIQLGRALMSASSLEELRLGINGSGV